MTSGPAEIQVTVNFFSFFKDLAGCKSATQTVPRGSNLGNLITALTVRFPQTKPLEGSMLSAVGVEYQGRDYVLQAGDEISLFPPVQGG